MSVRAGARSVGFSDFAHHEKRQSLIFDKPEAVIDLSRGAYCEIALVADVENLRIMNWLGDPIVNRVTLEIRNPGFHRIDLSFAKWPGATQPVVTPNSSDLIEIVSSHGGQPGTIIGRIWQNIR